MLQHKKWYITQFSEILYSKFWFSLWTYNVCKGKQMGKGGRRDKEAIFFFPKQKTKLVFKKTHKWK